MFCIYTFLLPVNTRGSFSCILSLYFRVSKSLKNLSDVNERATTHFDGADVVLLTRDGYIWCKI